MVSNIFVSLELQLQVCISDKGHYNEQVRPMVVQNFKVKSEAKNYGHEPQEGFDTRMSCLTSVCVDLVALASIRFSNLKVGAIYFSETSASACTTT